MTRPGPQTEHAARSTADLTPPVCVLGMHRSGTSLTARILDLLGIALGPRDTMLAADPDDNARGYWEQSAVMALNDDVLAKLGGSAPEPPPAAPGWERSDELEPLRRRADTLLADLFTGETRWGWKDPRTSLTLPFWRQLVEPSHYVLCVRHPMEVVASLHRRHGDPSPAATERSLTLWLRYNQDALVNTAGRRRLLVLHDRWFSDTERQLERLAEFAGVSDNLSEDVRREVEGFLDADLRHHTSDPLHLAAGAPTEVSAMYVLLRHLAMSDTASPPSAVELELTERLAGGLWDIYAGRTKSERALRAELALAAGARDDALGLQAAERSAAEDALALQTAERAAAAEALQRCEADLAAHQQWLAAMKSSVSWRLTAPLRRAKRLARTAAAGRRRDAGS